MLAWSSSVDAAQPSATPQHTTTTRDAAQTAFLDSEFGTVLREKITNRLDLKFLEAAQAACSNQKNAWETTRKLPSSTASEKANKQIN